MAKQVFKATAKPVDGLTISCVSRDFKLILDEPPALGGNDKGPNPVEAVLMALAACKSIVIKSFAPKFRINLKELTIETEGDLDPDGFMGKNPDAAVGFSAIRTYYHIEADNDKEEIEKFIKFVESHCPVDATLSNPADMSYEIK